LIAELYLSSQERPKTTRFYGNLMILNAIMLWYPFRVISNGITSPDIRGLLLVTSTGIRCFFITSGNLWWSTKPLSMKHTKAPKSNKAWTLILLESIFTISRPIKQEKASEVKIGPLI
jgi:hypothetical protein